MEHTGMYWLPIALALKEAGFFVSGLPTRERWWLSRAWTRRLPVRDFRCQVPPHL
jgi:hypothetical protein